MAAKEMASWHECKGGTEMAQSRYEELVQAGAQLSEEEAKEKISQEFGFIEEAIVIVLEVSTYEANGVRLRKKETFTRKPIYATTDWNYIRFNVKGWMYEMVNGELKLYEC